jgi:hypothetical protein
MPERNVPRPDGGVRISLHNQNCPHAFPCAPTSTSESVSAEFVFPPTGEGQGASGFRAPLWERIPARCQYPPPWGKQQPGTHVSNQYKCHEKGLCSDAGRQGVVFSPSVFIRMKLPKSTSRDVDHDCDLLELRRTIEARSIENAGHAPFRYSLKVFTIFCPPAYQK